MPLQRALGVFDKGIKRNLVVWAGREGGMRHLERTNEAALQEEVKKAIASHNRRCVREKLFFMVTTFHDQYEHRRLLHHICFPHLNITLL